MPRCLSRLVLGLFPTCPLGLWLKSHWREEHTSIFLGSWSLHLRRAGLSDLAAFGWLRPCLLCTWRAHTHPFPKFHYLEEECLFSLFTHLLAAVERGSDHRLKQPEPWGLHLNGDKWRLREVKHHMSEVTELLRNWGAKPPQPVLSSSLYSHSFSSVKYG